jgi:hypothetical protein
MFGWNIWSLCVQEQDIDLDTSTVTVSISHLKSSLTFFDVKPSDTVSDIKERIFAEFGTHPNAEQCHFSSGHDLYDSTACQMLQSDRTIAELLPSQANTPAAGASSKMQSIDFHLLEVCSIQSSPDCYWRL